MLQYLSGARSEKVRRPHSVGPRLGTSPFHDLNDPQFGVQANAVGTPVESPSGPRPNLRGSASDRRGTASWLLARNAARRPKSSNLRGTLSRDHSPERHALTDAEDEPEQDQLPGILEDLAHEPMETRMSYVEKTLLDDHQKNINGLLQRIQILEQSVTVPS